MDLLRSVHHQRKNTMILVTHDPAIAKTADRIMPAHRAQMINYLSATEHTVGLILNFGPTPTFARLIFQSRRKR